MNPADDPSGGDRSGGPGRPGLRPTSVASLVLAALGSGVAGWLFIRNYYGEIPDLNWLPGLTLIGLAIVEYVTAHNTRAKVEQRRGYGRINPLLVARFVVLAKASSMAGAIFAGIYGGIAVWALADRDILRAASANLSPAVAGLVGALALASAGLLLERACRVPPSDDDDPPPGTTVPPGRL